MLAENPLQNTAINPSFFFLLFVIFWQVICWVGCHYFLKGSTTLTPCNSVADTLLEATLFANDLHAAWTSYISMQVSWKPRPPLLSATVPGVTLNKYLASCEFKNLASCESMYFSSVETKGLTSCEFNRSAANLNTIKAVSLMSLAIEFTYTLNTNF